MGILRGIHEKLVRMENVLPGVSEAELLEKAGLGLAPPSKISPFHRRWQYGGSEGKEVVTLDPGEHIVVRATEANAAKLEWVGQGILFIEEDEYAADPSAYLTLAIAELRRVHTFYRDRGNPKIAEYRRNLGLTREDIEDRKHSLFPWFMNAAKADAIEEKIKALQAELVALSRPPEKVEPAEQAIAAEPVRRRPGRPRKADQARARA